MFGYTWSQSESLEELATPERVAEIKARHEKALATKTTAAPGQKLIQIFAATLDEDDDTEPCLICSL